MENKEEIKKKMKEYGDLIASLSDPFKTAMAQKLAEQLTKQIFQEKIPQKEKQVNLVNENQKIEINNTTMKNSIDRTAYPELKSLSGTLEKALFILKIMAEKGYEWLNPAQIYEILYDTFKQSINRPAITMALFRDTSYSQKKGEGRNTSYRLSTAGEEYISKKVEEINNPSGQSSGSDTDLNRGQTMDKNSQK